MNRKSDREREARKFGIGIVGFGRIGAEHARWIDASERLQVVGVADATAARRAIAQKRGYDTFDDSRALFSAGPLDAVLIATPTSMHFEHAMLALEAGKHVMVEKPATLDAATARLMMERAKERSLTLSTFHCRRWDLDYLTIQQLIRDGALGRVFNIESRLGQWASCVGQAAKEYRPGWRNEAAFGGGGLLDWGSHFIDQLWQLMLPARPLRVFAHLRGNVWTSDCDDFARVLIDFDNGTTGLCEINTTTTRPFPRWHLDGTLGSADAPHSPVFNTREWAQVTVAPANGETPRTMASARPGLSETALWEAFAEAVITNGEPPVPMNSVLMTMRLLDAARESSRLGQSVSI